MNNYEDIYSEFFDLSKIKSDDKKNFMRTALKDFPVAGAVLLHIFTLGLFSLIYYGIAHSKFPKIKRNDFSAGRAIGFRFIPFFNLYWHFVFDLRLVDRINLQLKLRDIKHEVPKGLILTNRILGVIPYLNLLTLPILSPIGIGVIQSGINKIVHSR